MNADRPAFISQFANPDAIAHELPSSERVTNLVMKKLACRMFVDNTNPQLTMWGCWIATRIANIGTGVNTYGECYDRFVSECIVDDNIPNRGTPYLISTSDEAGLLLARCLRNIAYDMGQTPNYWGTATRAAWAQTRVAFPALEAFNAAMTRGPRPMDDQGAPTGDWTVGAVGLANELNNPLLPGHAKNILELLVLDDTIRVQEKNHVVTALAIFALAIPGGGVVSEAKKARFCSMAGAEARVGRDLDIEKKNIENMWQTLGPYFATEDRAESAFTYFAAAIPHSYISMRNKFTQASYTNITIPKLFSDIFGECENFAWDQLSGMWPTEAVHAICAGRWAIQHPYGGFGTRPAWMTNSQYPHFIYAATQLAEKALGHTSWARYVSSNKVPSKKTAIDKLIQKYITEAEAGVTRQRTVGHFNLIRDAANNIDIDGPTLHVPNNLPVSTIISPTVELV